MGVLIDLAGRKFGKLLVIERAETVDSQGNARWNCLCNCGNSKTTTSRCLRSGDTISCGCAYSEGNRGKRKTHGGSESETYTVWTGMRARCYNKRNPKYPHYGGRGICVEWESYAGFLADMGEKPKGLSIDRIDVNGNYSKNNCRWATQLEQQNNRRNNRIVEFNGESLTMAQFCRKHGLNEDKVQQRLSRGSSVEQAMRA